MTKKVTAVVNGEVIEKPENLNQIEWVAQLATEGLDIIRFRGQPKILAEVNGFWQYTPLSQDDFKALVYTRIGGIGRSKVSDVYEYRVHVAEDRTDNSHLILFGSEKPTDEQLLAPGIPPKPQVWNTRELRFDPTTGPDACPWRSPYAPIPAPAGGDSRLPFIMELAGHDVGVYDDIMQSIAPMIMEKKPDGAIWWVGDGANGKSTLMDALYRIFPRQLSSLTVARLEDARDVPMLNYSLANIVKESSEGRVEDTQAYKSIGTHENFNVHRFRQQDGIEINGNMHHIFSANTIPLFADKGHSARRRTFIVPFRAMFASDPTFEDRTFTPEFFGRLISEMCKYAVRLRDQGYKYKWSAIALAAKLEYDENVNSAEAYVQEAIKEGLVAFDNCEAVKLDYERWCREAGHEPLRIGALKKALKPLGFDYRSSRIKGRAGTSKVWRLPNSTGELVEMNSIWRTTVYSQPGFEAVVPPSDIELVPEAEEFEPEVPAEPDAKEPSFTLDGKW